MYYVPFTSNLTGNQAAKANNGIRYQSLEGTTSSTGEADFIIGNNIASGTVTNKQGRLRIYSPSTGYTDLVANTSTASSVLTLPSKTGIVATTSDIPTSLKNPNSLTISLNGTSQGAYDGSSAKSINVTPASIGAAISSHTHNELTGMSSIVTIKKTLVLTTDWMDTGIKGTDLPSGSYIIQISGMDSSATSLYSEIFTGIMSWYGDITNSDNADEIILHKAGHASNGRTIYLRTLRSGRDTSNPYLRLQICSSVAFTSSSYTFSFRKMI